MDFKLAVLTYGIPGLIGVLAIPMALGFVPPNRYYGFRTAKSMASADVWYRANRICGWCLVVAAIAAIAHNALFLTHHPDWSSNSQQFVLAISNGILLLSAIAVAAWCVKKI
jgi:uncharacterized membrane protein